MEAENNASDLRVASFSCYLKSAEDSFLLKLGEGLQNTVISPPESTPFSSSKSLGGRSKIKEGEISIFGADKYFNMKLDPYETLAKPTIKTGTPSVNSEASSWNSRTALTRNFSRNPSQKSRKRPIGRRFFPSFGCNGPCSDKKAVYILNQDAKQSLSGDHQLVQFTFPILDSGVENLTVKKLFHDEESRKSLEVFGSDSMKKAADVVAVNLERKLSMLTWDAIPKQQILIPPTNFGAATVACDDMASDASSDLFEIDNISGSACCPVLTRQGSGSLSGCMTPTTQYAPSEASIEWSVVTASAVAATDFTSDYDEMSVCGGKGGGDIKNTAGKEAARGSSGGLLGCRNHKAVRVAESLHRGGGSGSGGGGGGKAKPKGLDSSFSFHG